MKRRLVAAALLLIGGAAAAEPAIDIRGACEGEGAGENSVRAIVLDPEAGTVAAALGVGAEECAGGLTAVGTLADNVLEFRPYKKEEGAEWCVVTLGLDRIGTTATIAQHDRSFDHGARCAFQGALKAKPWA